MIVLDTNVLSELMRPRPEPAVEAWLAARSASSLYVTTVTQAELFYGVAILPQGRRRARLHEAVEAMFATDFADRVLPFDGPAARAFAEIGAARRGAGRPIAQLDAQNAGIARSRDAAIATRNVQDFLGCDLKVHDPWGG